jgi:hypothetical protein
MNHSYDQQDIDISLALKPCESKIKPKIVVKINEHVLFEGILNNAQILPHTMDLMSSISISIELMNKDYRHGSESGVIIDSLKIDCFELIPSWTHLFSYNNDHANNDPTNHLGYNGTWSLNINEPFYRWQHKITGQGWLLEP